MSDLLQQLLSRLVLGDGALGTLFYQRGQPLLPSYDLLNLQNPGLVQQAHREYLEAGAELIETNTFGANRFKLERVGLAGQVEQVNRRGAELALELARPAGAYVAGSIGPLSPNPSDILDESIKRQAYQQQVEGLCLGGVNIFFLESFAKASELVLALETGRKVAPDGVFIGSLSFSDDGHTADGLRIGEAFARLREAGADIRGINCHMGPMASEKLLEELEIRPGDLISVYPNAGRPQFYEGRYIYHPTPNYFAEYLPRLVRQGARLVGGCCGTTPETIQAMAAVRGGLEPVSSKPAAVQVQRLPERISVAPAAPTLLEVYRERNLIVTELDPPKGLSLEKMVEGARALKSAGTDFVTMADNSLAILRLSNLATGYLVKDRTGLEPVIHLACRDRNLLGLQSELMGMHALGLSHVLALTGDPAKVGDHPGASSVYDVNSIGLIKMVKRLNEGFAANGRDLKARTRFIIGCAFNPNARNIESQVRKLEDKLKAGAEFVMTQPVFDPCLAKLTHEKTKPLGVPVLVGVMPLLNSRNAEFLHHEVPGIVIPDPVRERLRGKEGAAANAEGLAIAREITESVLEHFRGIYLITPLMRFDLTVQLSRFVRENTRV